MNTLGTICVFISITQSLSKPSPENLDYTNSLQVLPVKMCEDLIAAGHNVKISILDDGDINYAMCVLKGPFKTNSAAAHRRSFVRPGVEVGPGEFKSEPLTYDPELTDKRFKYLLERKKKLDEEERKRKEMLAG